MEEIKKVLFFLELLPLLIVFLVLFIVIVVVNSSNGNPYPDETFSIPFNNDVVYNISSPFGERIDPINNQVDFHTGIDLVVPEGTPILASASGIVYKTGYNDSIGNYVYLQHFVDGMVYYTVYCHMLDNSIIVQEGQPVAQKEMLGIVGATGRVTGRHLHFTLMSPEPKWDTTNLKDPKFIFEKKEENNVQKQMEPS